MNKYFKNKNNLNLKIYLQILRIVNFLLFLNFFVPFNGYRVLLLKLFGAKIGSGVIIRPGVKVYNPKNIIIKNNSWIGENVNLYSLDKILIHENVILSQEVFLCTGSHNYKSKYFETIHEPIIIHKNSWICIRSTILMGVIIPKNSIISAASIVNKKNLQTILVDNK